MNLRTIAGITRGCAAAVLVTVAPVMAQQAPCSECGPGSHWVDTCSAGQDVIADEGALVGIDLDLDCVVDPGMSLILSSCGDLTITRSDPLDESANFSGTGTADGHLDVIDTEIVSMCLTGGGVTLVAGSGKGQNGVLRASTGAIQEQSANDQQADSFFDVFFEVDLGAGAYAYNHTAMRIQININCVPPQAEYIHVTDCIELFNDPTGGTKVANLVSAEHHVYPNHQAACCTEQGTCTMLTQSDCDDQGGSFHPGADCNTTGACCLDNGAQCVDTTQECCEDLGGEYKGDGSTCLGDQNNDDIDDACERCGTGLCGEGGGSILPLLLVTLAAFKLRIARARRTLRRA